MTNLGHRILELPNLEPGCHLIYGHGLIGVILPTDQTDNALDDLDNNDL